MMSSIDKDKDYEQAILVHINLVLPLHTTSLGSGSHSPFSIHVVELGPLSTIPGRQENETLFPSTSSVMSSETRTDFDLIKLATFSQ